MSATSAQLPDGCPPLISYYVYLTGGCNLACQHCWLSPKFLQNGDAGICLDYDLFRQAVEEAIPLGLNGIKLTGGEPLLHPDFVRMVDLIAQKGLVLTIETNGTLLTRSLARYLKDKSTLNNISVSLDGAKAETHDRHRGVEGSFEKACNAIRYLVEVGYRPQVIMSLYTDSIGEIEALVQMAENLGAGSVKFNLIQPTGRGALMKARGQVLDLQRQIELGRWVEDELQERVSIPLRYSWPMAFFSIRNLLHYHGHTCSVFSILGLLPTGHLAMCGIGVHVPELCYGKIGEDPVANVWTSNPVLLELRKSLPHKLEGICGECLFRDRCLGNCIAHSYYSAGHLMASDRFCQEAADAGLFPSSRRHIEYKEKTEVARSQNVLIRKG